MIVVKPKGTVLGLRNKFFGLLKASGLLLVIGFSSQSLAVEFQCEIEGDKRYLRLEIPGKENLCEVSVSYDNTGERRVMWYADKDTLFCSKKVYALKDKYEQQWKFKCEQWPDLDGIDQLSSANRKILDFQLKALIEKGKESTPSFSVSRIKAVESQLDDGKSGTLAVQFFLSDGDVTQILNGDAKSWRLLSSIDNLATHISSDLPVSTALITAITDSGTLEIETTLASEPKENCYGQQVFATNKNELKARTEHRYICDQVITAKSVDE